MANIDWRKRKTMPEREKSTVMEEQETQRGAQLDPATELPPPESDAIAEPGEAAPGAQAGPVGVASQAELEKVKAERDQLLDRLARLQAEFENARKRGERERQDFRDFATGNVVEQFLPVMDNFQLALKATGSAEQLRAGVDLIVKQMEEVLSKLQVAAVPAVGEMFDPHIHEALGSVERDDVPDHQVVEEIRRGYKLREKLLRPALVRVASNAKQVSE